MPTIRETLENMPHDEIVRAAEGLVPKANLMDTLLNDPETRAQVQRLILKKNPQAVIPEIAAADATAAALKERDDKIAELQRANLEREVKERAQAQRTAIMAKYGLNDADMEGVHALMVAEVDPIPTYDAAARVYVASRQSAVPTASLSPPSFEMPEKDVWGAGIGNRAMLDKIARDEAYAALNDLRSGKVGRAAMGAPIRT
jgi:hypothetical protein